MMKDTPGWSVLRLIVVLFELDRRDLPDRLRVLFIHPRALNLINFRSVGTMPA